MQHPSLAALMITGLVSTSFGCASTDAGSRSSNDSVALPDRTTLTIENILRWPLEGETGYASLVGALNSLPGMSDVAPAYLMTRQPVTLGDGYMVDFVSIQKKSQHIDIGVDTDACVDPVSLQAFVPATQSKSTEDIHGRDVGRVYWSINNGTVVKFRSMPGTRKCVDSISIYRRHSNEP